MNLLKSSFSNKAAENVMCKHLISIGHDGYVYDCDFNQMLKIPLSNKRVHISQLTIKSLEHLKIATLTIAMDALLEQAVVVEDL